jgi:hypothetical protein
VSQLLTQVNIIAHVKWVPCHHGMVHPQVADGGDSLQIWRLAANILNKQSWAADRWWSSSFGVGRGANTPPPHHKPLICYGMYTRASEQDKFFG